MKTSSFFLLLGFAVALPRVPAAEIQLRQVKETSDPHHARIRVLAGQKMSSPIARWITGKFCEHLGANIYNGMEAQILRNPTFADYPIWNGQMSFDGVTKFHTDEEKIGQELRRQALRIGWPDAELDELAAARAENLSCWWARYGARGAVQFSPDTGPNASRAQRIEAKAPRTGIGQWTTLPLHRTGKFEFEIFARSPDLDKFSVGLIGPGKTPLGIFAQVEGLSADWKKFTGRLEIPPDADKEAAYEFVILAEGPGQFILQRALLRPADHIQGADPDVIRFLKESRLPLLRWPGGNFVSTYQWEDGVGPLELRPTKPNYAWGGIEPNHFGTDEFVEFCRAVGCEPMICVNAGSGTPEEAARWIEYCNGPASSLMGAKRAANGHPEPYKIKFWEVGNELWGRWQMHWTTAPGYVDRYLRFAKPMRAADRNVQLLACGAPVLWGKSWNDTLIAGAANQMNVTTDHPLIGGSVSPSADPLDVYRDFMWAPEVLQNRWSSLEQDMIRAGIREPKLAVTELQLFARIQRDTNSAPVRLTQENLVNPSTLAEALYDVLLYHAAIRLGNFVEMVTHSATVNHGGGLRKQRERVFANPCHYAQAAFASFAGAIPVAVEIDTPFESAPVVLGDLKNVSDSRRFGAIDALAALDANGRLLLSMVHRGTQGPIVVKIELSGFDGVKEVKAAAIIRGCSVAGEHA